MKKIILGLFLVMLLTFSVVAAADVSTKGSFWEKVKKAFRSEAQPSADVDSCANLLAETYGIEAQASGAKGAPSLGGGKTTAKGEALKKQLATGIKLEPLILRFGVDVPSFVMVLHAVSREGVLSEVVYYPASSVQGTRFLRESGMTSEEIDRIDAAIVRPEDLEVLAIIDNKILIPLVMDDMNTIGAVWDLQGNAIGGIDFKDLMNELDLLDIPGIPPMGDDNPSGTLGQGPVIKVPPKK